MDATLRNQVRQRAGDQCEYCLLRQEDTPFARFHIEHIVPRQHCGGDEPGNLALAVHRCNRHMGPSLTEIDVQTGDIARLFNPRAQDWAVHFVFQGPIILGLTPIGRATAQVLDMNAPARLELRMALMEEGRAFHSSR